MTESVTSTHSAFVPYYILWINGLSRTSRGWGCVSACFETRNFVALLSMTKVGGCTKVRHPEEPVLSVSKGGRLEGRTAAVRA